MSAGRDRAGAPFAHDAVALHLRFYLRALRAFLGADVPLRVSVTDLASDPPRARFAGEPLAELGAGFPAVEVRSDPARASGRGYYRDVCFKLDARAPSGEWLELADGGAVDWTKQLLGNAKERLAISGIGSERVVSLRG